MSDDDEITGVHSLPHPVAVVIVGITERLRRHGERHDELALEVREMKPQIRELHDTATSMRASLSTLKWLGALLLTGTLGQIVLALIRK